MFEAVAIRKAGFPFRLLHKQFANMYRCLVPAKERLQIKHDGSKGTAEQLIKMLAKQPEAYPLDDVKVGKTRVFFRSSTNRALEVQREKFVADVTYRLQSACRGSIARGVRRRLASAKAELAAAVAAKELARLDAALVAVRTPHRAFYACHPLHFVLHVAELADVLVLQKDLQEELRVEASLAQKIAETDLQAVYSALKAEHQIGTELAGRLGRPVPSLAPAECVIGLSEGVHEHDHERLAAAMSAANKMGLAARLGPSIEQARVEIAALEGGMTLENALTSELKQGRSKYGGSGKWDHAPISTTRLQTALDAAVKHPLISKSGKRLMAHARAAIRVRDVLLKNDWHAVKRLLEGLDAAEKTAEEAEAAWSEMKDTQTMHEDELEKELKQGRSMRVAEGRWEHGSIRTTGVADKQKALDAFPTTSDRGRSLLGQATLVLSLRQTLAKCDATAAASWGGLATLLEKVATDLREGDEVQAAWQEFREVRATTEAAVTAALDTGRSVRMHDGWSHGGITIDPLKAALSELEAFPRVSDKGKVLATRAVRTVMVREALLQADVDTPSSWAPVAEVLDASADQSASAYDASAQRGNDELALALDELNDARERFTEKLRIEAARGQSKKVAVGKWDRSELAYVQYASSAPCPTLSLSLFPVARAAAGIRELCRFCHTVRWCPPTTVFVREGPRSPRALRRPAGQVDAHCVHWPRCLGSSSGGTVAAVCGRPCLYTP